MKLKRRTRILLAAGALLTYILSLTFGAQPVEGAAVRRAPKPSVASQSATLNLTDFGAVGDNSTDAGPALQSALDALAAAGGGTLLVPAGRFAIVTPVSKNFTGLASSITILGVPSDTPVPPPTAPGNELSAGLDLVSEFAPRTGETHAAINITGLDHFLIQDITFIGTVGVPVDAAQTLVLDTIADANVRHCEFYGLSTTVWGGAIIYASRTDLKLEQSAFLGSSGTSGTYVSLVQNVLWKGVHVENTVFVDYGQRPELFGKNYVAPYSWVNIGNAAQPEADSPRREVVIRDVFFDEGALAGLSSLPYSYQPLTAPIDLIYVSGLFMNVANLNTSGHYLEGVQRVMIEKSHYGWSHNADSAINLVGVGEAILDEVECVAEANRIRADSSTGKLTVINSIYTHLDSLAHVTDVINTATPEEDPVQYVRTQYEQTAGREPDAAGHFYWSNMLLACGADAQCATQARNSLAAYLAGSPSADFSISGRVTDDGGASLPGVRLTLSGSQPVIAETDADGQYRFSGLPTSGVYTVTPTKQHYTFAQAAWTFTTPGGDQDLPLVATLNRHDISGRLANGAGVAVAGATVTLSGAQSGSDVTDANGNYSFEDLPAGGSYTVTPSKASHTFSPASRTFDNLSANQTGNFVSSLVTYKISGRVTSSGAALSGVTMSLSGLLSNTTLTDANGDYSFTVPAEGDYTVTPSKAHYTFAAPSATFQDLSANQTANFTGTPVNYRISGRVTSGGVALAGATVVLSGAQSGSVVTDASGNYSFTARALGNYNVSVTKKHYTFAAGGTTINNLSGDQTADFSGTLNRHAITGRVANVNNYPMGGVTLTLSGAQSATTTTDASGNYSFSGLPAGGTYTITPTLKHHSFTPQNRTFSDLGSDQYAQFVATHNTHTISGRVTNAEGAGMSGVAIQLDGPRPANIVTGADGNFSFAGLGGGGNYAVTPSLPNHNFTPPSRVFNDLGANQTVSFVGALNVYTISGRVTQKGAGLAGATVTLSGSKSATATTGANGEYSFSATALGNYTVTPSKKDYVFAPASASFNNLVGNQTADFAATLQTVIEFATASLSTNESAQGFFITVTRRGDTSGTTTVVYSANNGTAQQGDDLGTVIGLITFAPGETTKIVPIFIIDDAFVESDEQLTFALSDPDGGAILGTQASATLIISDNDGGSAPPSTNPVDDTGFFVRQHYRDFLNREPDAGGLDFWTNEIEQCGTDQQCRQVKRINVSAAFFLSIEFQETGFLVHRLYEAAYGRAPRRVHEFMFDAKLIGSGLIVGTPGWPEKLAANKQAFIAGFVAREDFASKYPTYLTPAQFVNALNATAGHLLTEEELSAAAGEFDGAPDSTDASARAHVLRLLAESNALTQRETPKAFVRMQYFGYLQRNPDDAPDDENLIGYNFWLQKLMDHNGNFQSAEMVRSFIESIEYRTRFAP